MLSVLSLDAVSSHFVSSIMVYQFRTVPEYILPRLRTPSPKRQGTSGLRCANIDVSPPLYVAGSPESFFLGMGGADVNQLAVRQERQSIRCPSDELEVLFPLMIGLHDN
jgi:hypothetical protein